jgi:hypothetical protein
MSKPRSPTLKQLTGERPHCQYCGKELRPVTCTVEVTGYITEPPTVDELIQMAQPGPSWPPISIAVERGYLPERVFLIRHKTNHKTEPVTAIHFWTCKDHGYGYADTPKHFCNNDCGRLLGLAAWRAGYRMKGGE